MPSLGIGEVVGLGYDLDDFVESTDTGCLHLPDASGVGHRMGCSPSSPCSRPKTGRCTWLRAAPLPARTTGGPDPANARRSMRSRRDTECEGLKVAVVDADPNRAYASWAEGPYEGPSVAVRAEADEARLAEAIDELAPEADLVLIDTAGFGNRTALLGMAAADAVLIPCTPSRADIEQAAKTLQLAEGAARAARWEIPARVVPARLKYATAVSRHVLSELEGIGLPRTAAGIGDRVAFAEMTFSGRVPASRDASTEIAALIAELRNLGWILPRAQPSARTAELAACS